MLTAYRNGDIIEFPNGDRVKLLSDAYYDVNLQKMFCNCDKYFIGFGNKVLFTFLMDYGKLIENIK